MLSTLFTELLGCRLPIQQAPMGGVTTPELVAAVAGAGGVGMVPAQMLPADGSPGCWPTWPAAPAGWSG